VLCFTNCRGKHCNARDDFGWAGHDDGAGMPVSGAVATATRACCGLCGAGRPAVRCGAGPAGRCSGNGEPWQRRRRGRGWACVVHGQVCVEGAVVLREKCGTQKEGVQVSTAIATGAGHACSEPWTSRCGWHNPHDAHLSSIHKVCVQSLNCRRAGLLFSVRPTSMKHGMCHTSPLAHSC
jgi:hypothetical protein